MWIFNILLGLVFGVAAGIFVIWRGKVAIRDRYITNSAKSALFTGVTHHEGEQAVRSGKILVVMGYIMAIGSGLGLLGVGGIACLLFVFSAFGGGGSSAPSMARGPEIDWVEDEFGNEVPVPADDANFIQDMLDGAGSGVPADPGGRGGPARRGGPRGIGGGGGINSPIGGDFFDDANEHMNQIQQEAEQRQREFDREFEEMQRQTEREMEQMNQHIENVHRQHDEFFEQQQQMIDRQFAQNRPGGPGRGAGFGAPRNIGVPSGGITRPPMTGSAPMDPSQIVNNAPRGREQLDSGPVELGTPPAALPVISFDERKAIQSHMVGFDLASGETIDDPPDGGVMVGMIVGVDTGVFENIQNIQAVYQIGNEYVEGQVIGQPGGRKEVILAPEGHAVYGLEVQSSTGIDAIRLGFMPMDERGRLKRRETQVSEWVGKQGSGGTELVDGGGKVIVAIYGAFSGRDSLSAVGLFAANSIDLVEGASGLREWASADGQYTIRAVYVSHEDGVVTLRRENGDEIDVQIEALKLEDQDWIHAR
ncbi:MAG: SHD1 domain-containing protein [Planctomycetota bacterium]